MTSAPRKRQRSVNEGVVELKKRSKPSKSTAQDDLFHVQRHLQDKLNGFNVHSYERNKSRLMY